MHRVGGIEIYHLLFIFTTLTKHIIIINKYNTLYVKNHKKGGGIMNTRELMYKLQTALKSKNIIVCINTYQFYSQEQNRYIKMYKVKKGKEELIQTASQIKVIKTLKNLWDEVKDND